MQVTLTQPITTPDLNLQLKCQYGQQDILSDLKCLLDCTHSAHSPEPECQQPAAWMELLKCHGEQAFYCEGHAVTIKKGIRFGRSNPDEDLVCFHCDGLFDEEFRRI